MSWHARAACAGAPADVFFPPKGGTGVDARRICATCPVRLPCLAYALDVEGDGGFRQRHGIYGGLTPTERIKLNRRKRDRACHTSDTSATATPKPPRDTD